MQTITLAKLLLLAALIILVSVGAISVSEVASLLPTLEALTVESLVPPVQ
jgi:hypothetical protein